MAVRNSILVGTAASAAGVSTRPPPLTNFIPSLDTDTSVRSVTVPSPYPEPPQQRLVELHPDGLMQPWPVQPAGRVAYECKRTTSIMEQIEVPWSPSEMPTFLGHVWSRLWQGLSSGLAYRLTLGLVHRT